MCEKTKCPVCEKEVLTSDTSLHHVVPKSKGGSDTERICNICHKQIHALFTNNELAEIETIEALKSYPEIKDFVSWRQKREFVGKLKTRKSKRIRK